MEGKQILPLEEYLEKLEMVLETRRDLVVVARTDATEEAEILHRVEALATTRADRSQRPAQAGRWLWEELVV